MLERTDAEEGSLATTRGRRGGSGLKNGFLEEGEGGGEFECCRCEVSGSLEGLELAKGSVQERVCAASFEDASADDGGA